MGFHLEKGQRGLLIGQTGSGKTTDAVYQLRQTAQRPVIVFDTKIEPAFYSLPLEGETLLTVETLEDLQALAGKSSDEWSDYILVRPDAGEMLDKQAINDYVICVYDNFGEAFIYFDEIYSWHDNGKTTAGLIGLLTRGRSRGKTTLMSTQRPAWISRFCLTECQKLYIHLLSDRRDKKTVSDVVPNFDKEANPAPHHLYFFEVGQEKATLYKPVPLQETIVKENRDENITEGAQESAQGNTRHDWL